MVNQYVFSMTSRMVTIAAACTLTLCALLFLLGVQIGARFFSQAAAPLAAGSPSAFSATSPGAAFGTDATGLRPVADPPASASSSSSSNP